MKFICFSATACPQLNPPILRFARLVTHAALGSASVSIFSADLAPYLVLIA